MWNRIWHGKRELRGLYITQSGKKINADLNGAINIMRKKIPIKEIKGLEIYNPKKLKIITPKILKISCNVDLSTSG